MYIIYIYIKIIMYKLNIVINEVCALYIYLLYFQIGDAHYNLICIYVVNYTSPVATKMIEISRNLPCSKNPCSARFMATI